MKGKTTYCFGTGREEMKTKSSLVVPGPGTYDPLHPLGTDALKFTMKEKLSFGDPATVTKKKNIPPPGHYEIVGMHKEGRYPISEFYNSKSARWSKDERLKPTGSKYEQSPGPGAHETFGNTCEPNHVASQFHTIKSPSFNGSERLKQLMSRF